MITDLENINVHSLPSLPIVERNKLPKHRGLYFVLSREEIIYVGMTVNFQQRLLTHHKLTVFFAAQNAKVAWLQTDYEDLSALEKEAISFFNPKLNGRAEKDLEKQMDSALSIKLPLVLREKAVAKSKKTGIALSFIIRKALEDWLKEDEK